MHRIILKFTEWVIRWRWFVVFLVFSLTVPLAIGCQYLVFATDHQAFFSKNDPHKQAFENLRNIYTKDDYIFFALKPDSGIFNKSFLSSLKELTDTSWKIPYATRVDSLTNFQHSYADGDDLIVEELLANAAELTEQRISEIRQIALTDPSLSNRLISSDGKTTLVSIATLLPYERNDENMQIMTYARDLRDRYIEEFPNVEVTITGTVPFNHQFTASAQKDLDVLMPAMFLVLFLIAWVTIRSLGGAIIAFVVTFLAMGAAMGIAGWKGVQLTPASGNSSIIIMTVAIAYAIHLLVSILEEMRNGVPQNKAITLSVSGNFKAIIITASTTAIGFLSLNFSDSPPFHDLGNITALGVLFSLLFSMILLPALVAVVPFKIHRQRLETVPFVEKLAEFVITRYKQVFWSICIAAIILAGLVPSIEINDQFHSYFDRNTEFRRNTEFVAEQGLGTYDIQWSIPAEGAGGIVEPSYLNKVEKFKEWLYANHKIIHVNSIVDVFKKINKNLHNDNPDWYKLPENRESAAQYLLLYEMSLPYGQDLNNQINVDKSSSRVVVMAEPLTTNEIQAIDRESQVWLRENFASSDSLQATGIPVMFAYIFQRNIEGMLKGTLVAFLLISLILVFAFHNLKLGLVSLAPNILPVVMTFGVWAIFVGQVGLASSIIVATSLGIIVDDTVHFLTKYHQASINSAGVEDAIRFAFKKTGKALWSTSFILISGFIVLSFSTFKLNHNLGILMAIAIFCALVTDFLLLPALLILLENRKLRK